jgi:hypothetical protein
MCVRVRKIHYVIVDEVIEKKNETQRHKDTEKTQLDNSLSYKLIGAAIVTHPETLFLCVSVFQLKN